MSEETKAIIVVDLRNENIELKDKLKTAIKYLKEGKAKFTPNTTNSDVDYFIERNSHYSAGS